MKEHLATIASFASNYWATLALGALCAYLGVFTVLRRIVFTGAALAQAAAAGVAASFWALTLSLPTVLAAFVTTWGATLGSLGASVGSALALARGERRGRVTADAMVGVVFASSSALAILFVWRSSVGLVELKNILAGDVLLSSSGDLVSLWVGVLVVALVHAFGRERFLLVAYDPAFAKAQGLNVRFLERLFLASLAVAVAVALRAAGLMLVFGTLVLAPLVGLRVEKTLGRATCMAVGAAWSATMGGFLLSTKYNLPVAPTIVTCEVALLVAAMLLPRFTRIVCTVGGVSALAMGLALGAVGPNELPAEVPEPGPDRAPERPSEAEMAALYRMGGGHSHGGRGWGYVWEQRALAGYVDVLTDVGLSEQTRVRAAKELARMGMPDGLRPLLEVMGEPFEVLASGARRSAAVLTQAPSSRARGLLVEFADGADPELATNAALVLADLGQEGAWARLVERLADPGVPLLLREKTHTFLTQANGGDALGYDAFAEPTENAESLTAWREWATAR